MKVKIILLINQFHVILISLLQTFSIISKCIILRLIINLGIHMKEY